MTTRLKLKTIAPRTREEMETLVGEITSLKNLERSTTAKMDAALKAVKDHHQEALTQITDRLSALLPRALAWAEAHPDEFGKAKSLEMLHGIIGWRTNNPSLRTLAGWTWDRVLEKLKALGWLTYIRAREEPNKQALLADRETLGPDELRKLGLRVMQDDEFFVEPKLTETQTRETVSA